MASMNIKIEDFMSADTVIQLGMPPNRIDILTDLETLDFEVCYAQRETAHFDGLDIAMLDLDNLIKSKLNAGRPQDKVDAKKLTQQKKKP
jgi:hypothetical protein